MMHYNKDILSPNSGFCKVPQTDCAVKPHVLSGLCRLHYDSSGTSVRSGKCARSADPKQMAYHLLSCFFTGGLRTVVAVMVFAVTALSLANADDYSKWPHVRKYILNTTSTGALVSKNVLNFPILLRLNPGNFDSFSGTLDGGSDIRFSKTDGTHLPYQIERWKDGDDDNDTAEIWIRIDTVYGNNNTQSFIMYWGNGTASDSSSGVDVFNGTDGFMGTYHLGGDLEDASSRGNDGVDSNTVDAAGGLIGRARSFNGSSQFFNVGDLPDRTHGTISCWFRLPAAFSSSTTTTQGIWGKYEYNSINSTLSIKGTDWKMDTSGLILGKIENLEYGGHYFFDTTTTSLAANTWYHIAWSWGDTASLFVNGVRTCRLALYDSVCGTANDEIGRSYYDTQTNIEGGGPRYFNGLLDEFRIDNTRRTLEWVKLCYENQKNAQTLVEDSPSNHSFVWDVSADFGIQSGSGIWGVDDFWTPDSLILYPWPGRGGWATFSGIDGEYGISVSGVQAVDSITFRNNGYTFSGGTLDFGTKSGVYLAWGVEAKISSAITGSGGFTKYGRGTLVVDGKNSFTGVTRINAGTLSTSLLGDSASDSSSLGRSSDNVTGLVIGSRTNSGTLVYTGEERVCNRLFSIGNDTAIVVASGSGALVLENPGEIGFVNEGHHILVLAGENTADNTLGAAIGNYGATTQVLKTGTGKWVLTGVNTYTGATNVAEGTFVVNGSLASGSDVTVAAGATIGGSGTIAGSVGAAGAVIQPGHGGVGKFTTGTLVLDEESDVLLELGTHSDTLAVEGDIYLDGSVHISAAAGFAPGIYRVVTFTGTVYNDSLTVETVPIGIGCTFTYGEGFVDAELKCRLILSQPSDTAVLIGQGASFGVSAHGTGTLSYSWQRYPDEPVAEGETLLIASVTESDMDARFRCIVIDSFSSDTSRWATLRVVDTPRIITQPTDTTVTKGSEASFSVTVEDTMRTTFEWYRQGEEEVLGIGAVFIVAEAKDEDEGDYYCIITNPVASVSTDVVHLSVKPPMPVAEFTVSPESGIAPLEVSFTNMSEGVISEYLWSFGDGATDTAISPRHTYIASGLYTIGLRVTGPGGVSVSFATVSVRYETDNPLRISARFIGGTDACIIITNVNLVDTSGPLRVDSIGVWTAPRDIPLSQDQATLVLPAFYRSSFAGDSIFDTLTFPVSDDSVFGVMTSLFWNDGSISGFAPENGCTVLLRDTANSGDTSSRVGITYFDGSAERDTVTVFGSKVMLWKDESFTMNTPLIDTLEMCRIDAPAGCFMTGNAFKFVKGVSTLPMFIGISVDSLPDGATINDVRIYRDSAGVVMVEHGTVVDSAHGVVYVKTRDIQWPFFPMVDQVRPQVTFLSPVDSVVHSGVDIVDSITLSDNIFNSRWTYLYGRGGESAVPRDSGEVRSTAALVRLCISQTSQAVNSESGVRAMLVFSDGVYRDTVNVSRRVYRERSDEMRLFGKAWNPICPTADLYGTDADALVSSIVSKVGKYDVRYLRLFRWVETDDNAGSDIKWVEYLPGDGDVKSLFDIVPGRLLWLKTLRDTRIDFGPAVTMSLKDTFAVELAGRQFTDFGMPFMFPVSIADILSASGHAVDSVQFYEWICDTVSGGFYLDALYGVVLPGSKDPVATLVHREHGGGGGGYSLYNPRGESVILKIPPVVADTTATSEVAKKRPDPSWSASFVATTGRTGACPRLYCGYVPGLVGHSFPVAPSFSRVRIAVYDRTTGRKSGHYLADDASAGVSKELLCTNSSDSIEHLEYRLEPDGSFPENFKARIYDPLRGEFFSSAAISIKPGSVVSLWLIAGDQAWHDRFAASAASLRYGLGRVYPNPARTKVTIRYSVPLGAQERLTITVFDILGRRIWEKRIHALLAPGEHMTVWDGRDMHHNIVGAGRYPVVLSVADEGGRVVRRFQEWVTYLP